MSARHDLGPPRDHPWKDANHREVRMVESMHRTVVELARRIRRTFPILSPPEARIALAIYREMAEVGPAVSKAIADRAQATEAAVDAALDRWPGVYRDGAGRVIGFWGLALGVTPHVIRTRDRTLHAWCALDALFLGEILGEDLAVEARCAGTDRDVRLQAGPHGLEEVDPHTAVISFLDPERCDVEGDRVLSSFCHHILFFASERAWRAWEAKRRQGTFSLSVEEAFWLGREVNRIRYGDELDTEGR